MQKGERLEKSGHLQLASDFPPAGILTALLDRQSARSVAAGNGHDAEPNASLGKDCRACGRGNLWVER